MSAQLASRLPEDQWAHFVVSHPQGNVFHTPAMQAVFAQARGHVPVLRAALTPDGQILALLTAVEIRLAGGPLARLTSRAIAYGSVLCLDSDEARAGLVSLLRWHNDISGRRCLFTELRHRDDASSLQPALASAGFEHEQELNFLIDVSGGPDAVWDRFDRSACKNVRRAERDGLHVEEVNTAEGVSECYDLLRQVYAAVDVPLADISLFQASLDVLQPLGMVRMMLARSPEGLAGARAVLLYKDRVFDWYAGADREMRDSRPNDFLVWRTLEWAATHGYGLFDFGGAGHPDVPYGVRDFKAKFGGQLVNHGRVRCVHAPRLLRLSEAAYALLRRVL